MRAFSCPPARTALRDGAASVEPVQTVHALTKHDRSHRGVSALEISGTVTAGLRALPFVLMMTTGSTYALGGPLTCYSVRAGDTAAGLAKRFTGNARNRHQPWFQILNPATAAFIPKSDYGVIQSGWHVCVATEILRPPPVLFQTGVAHEQTPIGSKVSRVLWVVPLFAIVWCLVLTWFIAGRYVGDRRATRDVMRGFGDRFICELERPLFRRCAADSPLKSRLRFAPARHRLEILVAPAAGRTYPNLFDHRRNVEYDVERVLRLLNDQPFSSGPLHSEGPWVVIPFRFETNSQQEGVR
jgi:hypothetical protein